MAIVVCPLCQKRHSVRVNDGRARVECGALAEVYDGERYSEARVWQAGREDWPGRMALLVAVQE